MSKIKIGFSGLSVPEQIERARLIVTMMTGNASYTTPNPTLGVVTSATDVLETAYNESRNRDKIKMAAMRLRRKEFLLQIGQLSAYVQDASGGDQEKILSSGYTVAGAKIPHPVVAGEVTNVRLSDGSNSGKINVLWNKATDAVIYAVEVSPNADFSGDSMARGVSTKTHKEIGTLTPGTKYWVRVFALGREEFGPFTEPVSIIAR